MSAFLISNSGISDQRATLMVHDGLTFTAPGDATIQLNAAQFSLTELAGNPFVVTGNAQANTVEVFVGLNGIITMQPYSYVNWSANDTVILRDRVLNEEMQGSKFNDQFFITGGLDTIDGGAGGDDTVNIDWTNAFGGFSMNGGAQFNNFLGGASGVRLSFNFTAGPGLTNTVKFNIATSTQNTGGNDNLVLAAGDDSFSSGFGDDTLNMGLGDATVDGGVGTDLWISDFSNDPVAATVNINLAGVNLTGSGSSYANIERLNLIGGSGADVFISRIGNPNDGLGDTLSGGAGNDRLTVGGGVDVVDGGADNDVMIANWAGDLGNFGMNGAGQMTDFSNTFVTFTNIERFDITLGDGNDDITLGANSDTIRGNGGNDILRTGTGAATVDGGTGIDTWQADLSAQASAKSIDLSLAGTQAAGGGTTYANLEAMLMTTGTGNDLLMSLTAAHNDNINAGDGNDTIGVGGGLDTATGGLGSDDLLIVDYSAIGGNFSMNGATQLTNFAGTRLDFTGFERFNVTLGVGNDNVTLGGGNDTISGGDGNDILRTGVGSAEVDGGGGLDTWDADLSAQAGAKSIDLSLVGVQAAGGGTTYANLEAMIIATGAGNDLLLSLTAPYNDTINGGDGNDTIGVGGGLDNAAGGAGTDDLLIVDYSAIGGNFLMNGATQLTNFAGTRVDFSGFERFNVKLGGGNDSVLLLAGSDTANGGAGNDTLNTGIGDAAVVGGLGNDLWIADQSGDNRAKTIDLNLTGPQTASVGTTYDGIERISISTGGGNDQVLTRSGDGGADSINSGGGNDTISVGDGLDSVNGGLGTDLLIINWGTRSGNFSMNGGAQITNFGDTRVDLANIDRFNVTLGNGNDSVVLGALSDSINGGGGNDVLNTLAGDVRVDGGAGVDTWLGDLTAETANLTINLNLAGINAAGGGSFYGRLEAMGVTGGSGNDALTTLKAIHNDTLSGGGGNDTLMVGGGLDVVVGGAGDDMLVIDYSAVATSFFMNGPTQITNFGSTRVTFTEIERFDVTLSNGDNSIVLLAGNDTVKGGTGNDTFNTAAGAAVVDGGAGTDFWIADQSADNAAKTINLNSTGVQLAGNGTTYTNVEAISISTGNGNDSITTFNGVFADTVVTGEGADTITVFGGLDTVNGGLGNDLLIIDYSTRNTSFTMNGLGQITNFGDTRVSFLGFERINATLGNGFDNIVLGAGNDTVSGGLGNDTLNGGAGIDTLDLSGATGAITFSVLPGGNTIVSAVGIGADTFSGFENFISGSANDNLTGDGLANRLDGGAGDDTLRGAGGNNTLNGGDGDDLLLGGTNRDIVTGGLGADTMNGGGGFDTFVYTDAAETGVSVSTRDLIRDFNFGIEEIDLSAIDAVAGGADTAFVFLGVAAAFTAAGDLRLEQVGADTLVRLNLDADAASEAVIQLVGVLATDLTAGDFLL